MTFGTTLVSLFRVALGQGRSTMCVCVCMYVCPSVIEKHQQWEGPDELGAVASWKKEMRPLL